MVIERFRKLKHDDKAVFSLLESKEEKILNLKQEVKKFRGYYTKLLQEHQEML